MKTVLLNNIICEKELCYMYNQVTNSPVWRVSGQSTDQRGFMHGPTLIVKKMDSAPENFPLALWGQTLIYRIAKLLEKKNIGIPTSLNRMWFSITHSGKKTQHWLHRDDSSSSIKSILLFLTPVWQPDWRGSFFIDGKEIKFKPGSAVIFDSSEYHQGESSESEKYNWQRLTCNILVS